MASRWTVRQAATASAATSSGSAVVAVLGHGRGTTYPDMAWEPKQVFGALADAYAHAQR